MRRLAALAILAMAPSWAIASDLPRVVSVNLCTDQLVMLLADPAQVVSLSGLSDDPRSSAMADEASRYAKNNNRAESIAVTEPDVVVAGQFSDPALVNMLRSIDIEVVQFSLTTSLDHIPAQVRKMGEVLNRRSVAEVLARDVEHQLSARPELNDTAPLAAFFYPNGFALGAGTLSHDILTSGGARNLSVELGLSGNGRLSIEQVVLNSPDMLVSSPSYSGFSRSEEMTSHPALGHFPVLHSTSDWTCGTPRALRAVADVAEMVNSLRTEF